MEKRTKQRTCIECRKTDSKQQFIRIVRTPEGLVEYDPTGKANGRGAYVCSLACLEKALQTRKFDRALRVSVDKEKYEQLAQDVMSDVLD
ncbi:RNase P modulator RnpM [Anaerotardibacter muris]|uniref:RNase P modulator RnpM n=1 Tax=Anaerotardibacter muris TaxID=2941505 RepID=UPI00203C3DCE|nr:YlxR family protein [Anaerotardibacter muris]